VARPGRRLPAVLSEPARGFSVLATGGYQYPPVNFQAGMQQPGILQPAEADSQSIGRRRFTELLAVRLYTLSSFLHFITHKAEGRRCLSMTMTHPAACQTE
jgi:hypothetical protein